MSATTPDVTVTIQTLVLSDSPEAAELLASLLGQHPGLQARTARMAYGEGLRAVAQVEPHVVLVTDTIDDPAAVVETLDAAAPGLPSIVVLPEGDLRAAQECSLAGARATLLKPVEQSTLVEAIRHVHAKEVRRKQHVAAALEAGEARQQRPRIVAVYGAKGGVGTTTLACNLAAALRGLTGRRVALIDADVLGGVAGALFDLTASNNISDLLQHVKELDADLVDRLLAEHAPTGVRVLLAPDQLQRAETIGGDDIQSVLAGLKPYFDYQVVDTASRITPVTLAAMDEADLIVHVVTPEITSLRNAARFLQLAGQLGYPQEKVLLVANRADAGKDITPSVIEEYFRRPVGATVPSDGRTLVEHLNGGQLLVTTQPRNKVSRAVERLARDIATSFGWTPATQQARGETGASKRFSLPSLSLGRFAGRGGPAAAVLAPPLQPGSEGASA
jgi:pilus assembly protein CpaE